MLVLTRKIEEKIRIGDDITISILRVKGNTVRVGIDAPRDIRVVRGELPSHEQLTNGQLTNGQLTNGQLTNGQSTIEQASLDQTMAEPTDASPSQPTGFTVEVVDNATQDEGSKIDEVEKSDPATTAVRQFIANRARRRDRDRRPQTHRSSGKSLAASLSRSA